jgi:hypothetical protein
MTTHDSTMGDTDIHQNESANLISADRVKGTAVYDTNREKIGTIDSVMLTKQSGKVAYAIMSFGGFLGMGEKYHPLPWDMLDYDTDLDGYLVPTAGAALKDAPAYEREMLEHDATRPSNWRQDTDTYYGKDAGRTGTMAPANRFGDGSDRL